MKARNPNTGQFEEVYVKALDSLPVGSEIDFTGSSSDIPTGWEEITENPLIKTQSFTRTVTQGVGGDYWGMTHSQSAQQPTDLSIPTGYSVLGAIVTALPDEQKMVGSAIVNSQNVTIQLYNFSNSSVQGTIACKVLFIKNS